MDLGFAERDAHAQQRSVPIRCDSHRNQNRAGHYGAAVPDLFITRIEHQIGDLANRPLAPGSQFFIQEFGRAAHLRAGHLQPAELLHDFSDPSRGHALDIHLGDRQFQRPLAAHPLLQS